MTHSSDVVRTFQGIPLFESLSEEETWEILRCCEHHTAPAGTVLFAQGSEGSSAFVLAEGRVEIRLHESGAVQTVARFGPGDVFGELALLDAGPRSAEAVAVEDVSWYELRGERFEALRQQLHPAAYKVIRHLARVVARRLREVNERIEGALVGERPRPVRTARLAPPPGALDAPRPSDEGFPTVGEETAEPGFFRRLFGRLWGQGDDA